MKRVNCPQTVKFLAILFLGQGMTILSGRIGKRPLIQGMNDMANVYDVAEHILKKIGPMTSMKLQKLVYYSQAWHLAWTESPLFPETIQAWRDGPVVQELFNLHKGQFKIVPGFFANLIKPQMIHKLTNDDQDIVDRVIDFYGKHDPHWLSQLTHLEDPWKNARAECEANDRSTAEITHQAMFEYYSSL